MSINAIVSYDDTANDHDALVLGRLLADAGAELTLAYVRHATQVEHTREELEEHEAEALLERGARWLEDPNVTRRVVVSGSTAEGLKWLAEQEDAQIVVFGSDYRTASGHVAPGRSAQALLEGGPAALAIAPANYRAGDASGIGTVGVLAGVGDGAALETARELADAFGAKLTSNDRNVDLLVVGSRAEAPEGRVLITAQAQNAVENATAPVLVLARGVALQFPVPATV
jgi:nucleotide-binding universal stress UspA family protein